MSLHFFSCHFPAMFFFSCYFLAILSTCDFLMFFSNVIPLQCFVNFFKSYFLTKIFFLVSFLFHMFVLSHYFLVFYFFCHFLKMIYLTSVSCNGVFLLSFHCSVFCCCCCFCIKQIKDLTPKKKFKKKKKKALSNIFIGFMYCWLYDFCLLSVLLYCVVFFFWKEYKSFG